MKRVQILILALISLAIASGQNQVLQIFEEKKYTPVQWVDITEFELVEAEDSLELNIKSANNSLTFSFTDSLLFQSGYSIPHIEITTDEALVEIPNKKDYKKATFTIAGFGNYDDVSTEVNIRGRGNTSWEFDKKPYRLKFDKKISLCGLPKAKSYVLLANYTDPSLMQFAIATKLAQMLGMPYTNHVVPVDITLNGIYKGSYLLTNKPGINSGSVDIDEDTSIMWELDTYFDEDYRFKSNIYNLPVMAVDPDLTDELFEKWKADFNAMERAVATNNAAEYVDLDVFARYLLVYQIMDNNEIGWPKSVKLYKEEGGKYIFGPIWDFDVACGYVWESGESYSTDNIDKSVWVNSLFIALMQADEFKTAIKKHWQYIKEHRSELFEYIDSYAASIKNSAHRNQVLWPGSESWDDSIQKLKNFFEMRLNALDNFDMLK